ncbi:isoprenylcysteine carboxylmethyltransferase family protein [Iamia sp. SCSIO 61187]|uniref:methyltransferase family protein n=1 Tax=Iamia sp. SCSIO 61187 TaxID=2722752 RepID=UPI001C62714B|nr:isoprenylcysteine carboxylmethyltransferase family protein [Iamia sp. SCSIO 61187]QYG93432.1 isoprenylcysteine carboxylmethyltransferase family protein [Iamia sp. SCSIO 61187]
MTRPALALVSLVVFTVLGFGWRTVVQVRRHGDTGWRFSRTGLDRIVGPGLGLGFVLLAVGPAWALAAGDAAVPLGVAALAGSDAVAGAGAALAVVAGVLTVVAQVQMGASWRIGVEAGERTDLVTDGLFTVVRNPIFTGMLAFAGAVALLVPTLPTLAGAALAAVTIHVQVRLVEEPHLVGVHGAAYRRWAAATGRFVPGLGRLSR